MPIITSLTLPDLIQARDVEYGETRSINFSNFMASEISSDSSNGLSQGSDGKLFAEQGGSNYLEYVAIVSQSQTAQPSVIELANTLGESVSWVRTDVGQYNGNVIGDVFTDNKTVIFAQAGHQAIGTASLVFNHFDVNNVNQIALSTLALTVDTDWIFVDLHGTLYIEIRVYP